MRCLARSAKVAERAIYLILFHGKFVLLKHFLKRIFITVNLRYEFIYVTDDIRNK